MNKISSRQLYFFLAAIAPVGKLVLLPTQLVYYSKNDLLFPAAMNFVLQAAVIFFVLLLARHGIPFFALMKGALGRVGAKIVLTLFSAFLFYAAFLPLLEQKLFVQSVFYDTLPTVIAFSSFFLFSAYVCAKPVSSLSRTWDILAPLAVIGLAGILLLSAGNTDLKALSPAGATGASGIFSGFFYSMSWFFDPVILLSLLGKIEYKKGMSWKGALCYLAGGAAVLLFLAVFYGVFQDIAVRQQFAFTKISKYFSGISVLGRIDYLFIFALSLVMAFYAALPLHAGVELITQAYGREEGRVLPACVSAGVNLVMFVLTLFFDYKFITVNELVSRTLFFLFPLFAVLLPLLLLLLIRSRHETTQ